MKKILALLLAGSMILAFAACSKKPHAEQEVTAVVDVTDENGKTVTDKNGKAVTQVVTVPQTDDKGNTVAPAKNSSGNGSGNNSAAGGQSGNGNNSNSGGNSNAGGNSNSGGNSNAGGSDKTEAATDKKKPTEKPTTTTVAANRKIHIAVALPAGASTHTDKLRIFINDKQVAEEDVVLEIGKPFTYTTEKKYRGDVEVKIELVQTQKSESKTVKKGTDTVDFHWEGVENINGDDD